jgi:phosphonate transport system substrate-binding protein
VGIGVFNGDCVAGFVTDGTVENNLPQLENIDSDELRVFWQSEPVPGPPLVVHPSIPDDMVEKIKELILERANKDYMINQGLCTTFADCEFLTSSAWGYVATEASEYDSVRVFCAENKIDECQ